MGDSCCFPVATPALLCSGSQLWGKHKAKEGKRSERERREREIGRRRESNAEVQREFLLLKENWSYWKAENGTGCHLARSAVSMSSGCVCSYRDGWCCTDTGQDCMCALLWSFYDWMLLLVLSHFHACLDKTLTPFTVLWGYFLYVCVRVCRWDSGVNT